jgi:DNA-directed RNA polymerase beta subunit
LTGVEKVEYRCASVVSDKSGTVVDIIVDTNKDVRVVIFKLFSLNVPVMGDKYTSRHGQKGTISCLEPHTDLPFSRSGMVPDLIINPHAIPSRMTIGHLLEAMVCKASAMRGIAVSDGTSFSNEWTAESVGESLQQLGFARGGEEEFYCGVTGKRYFCKIFVGPTFYECMSQLGAKKAHARGPRGPTIALTKQPTDGKKSGGGFRFGEMERDATFSHGAGHTFKNLTVYNSDNAVLYFCRTCRQQAVPPPEWGNSIETHRCTNALCRSNQVVSINSTWAHNVVMHELRCLNIMTEYDVTMSIETSAAQHVAGHYDKQDNNRLAPPPAPL